MQMKTCMTLGLWWNKWIQAGTWKTVRSSSTP